MGIVNVTPDSFYEGSRNLEVADAVACGQQLAKEGVDILDVGGESTRPGSVPVTADEEVARILPVIQALVKSVEVPISVDTYKSRVAEKALETGAQMVNDISGLRFDPELASVVKDFDAAIVLSHTRGRPESMQKLQPAADIIGEVLSGLKWSTERAMKAGIGREQIVIDPGIGFGKTARQNVLLINRLAELTALGYPVLVGPSRKSFLGRIIGGDQPGERLFGTAASVACSILRGAAIVRVHDGAAIRQVAATADAILNEEITEMKPESMRVI